jgi:hypothetical protein
MTTYNPNTNANVNTTGYSSDQFLNLVTSGAETRGVSRTAEDNPEFYFPGKTPPNVYDVPGAPKTNTNIQRGFIRGIFPEVLTQINAAKDPKTNKQLTTKYTGITPPTRRCFFQFNPSLILRSVQASTTTLNPLLQDPTQLLQPIPGQASFEFQLLFNREHEVSAQEYINANGKLEKTSALSANLANYGADLKAGGLAYKQNQLGDLGVLVDLYVLDSIIGQSITFDSIRSIQAYWEATKKLRPSDELDKDGKPVQPYGDTDFLGTGTDTKYADSLNKVLGNSAFLNPMPIRIVFSSLFMVEGFVTASNVAFHKFSRNMVPTVCQVTLSVQAMYIGFAKKDSYVSTQLTEALQTDAANDAETSKNIADCIQLVKEQVICIQEGVDYAYPTFAQYEEATVDLNWQDNETLNGWFYRRYQNKIDNNYSQIPNLEFGYQPGEVLQTAFRNKLILTAGSTFRQEQDTAMNLGIESYTMYIYSAADANKAKYNNPNDIVQVAEKGNFDGVIGDLRPIATSEFRYINTKKNPQLREWSELDSDKWEQEKTFGKFNHDYFGTSLNEAGLDEERLKTPSAYFGTSVYVVFVLVITAESKAAVGDNVKNRVTKASGHIINPNTQGINAVNDPTFGRR